MSYELISSKSSGYTQWEICKTRRGHSIRSLANSEYLNVTGPKPVKSGMRLRAVLQRTSWKFEPIPGSEPSDIYRYGCVAHLAHKWSGLILQRRICWPDRSHAIGSVTTTLSGAARVSTLGYTVRSEDSFDTFTAGFNHADGLQGCANVFYFVRWRTSSLEASAPRKRRQRQSRLNTTPAVKKVRPSGSL